MTRENDTKRTQIYFVGPGNPRNQTPPPILRGGGVWWGHYNNIPLSMYSIAYEWNMHKMASKKFVSNFAWKGLQEKTKSDEGKERKGGGLYYYY